MTDVGSELPEHVAANQEVWDRYAGVLTEAEFEVKKAQLLARI